MLCHTFSARCGKAYQPRDSNKRGTAVNRCLRYAEYSVKRELWTSIWPQCCLHGMRYGGKIDLLCDCACVINAQQIAAAIPAC